MGAWIPEPGKMYWPSGRLKPPNRNGTHNINRFPVANALPRIAMDGNVGWDCINIHYCVCFGFILALHNYYNNAYCGIRFMLKRIDTHSLTGLKGTPVEFVGFTRRLKGRVELMFRIRDLKQI